MRGAPRKAIAPSPPVPPRPYRRRRTSRVPLRRSASASLRPARPRSAASPKKLVPPRWARRAPLHAARPPPKTGPRPLRPTRDPGITSPSRGSEQRPHPPDAPPSRGVIVSRLQSLTQMRMRHMSRMLKEKRSQRQTTREQAEEDRRRHALRAAPGGEWPRAPGRLGIARGREQAPSAPSAKGLKGTDGAT